MSPGSYSGSRGMRLRRVIIHLQIRHLSRDLEWEIRVFVDRHPGFRLPHGIAVEARVVIGIFSHTLQLFQVLADGFGFNNHDFSHFFYDGAVDSRAVMVEFQNPAAVSGDSNDPESQAFADAG